MGLTRISSATAPGLAATKWLAMIEPNECPSRTVSAPRPSAAMKPPRNPLYAGNTVPGSLEGGRAAEARQVRHDQAHVRQLVGYPEQAVVVAAEPVHHQDGAGLRGDPAGS